MRLSIFSGAPGRGARVSLVVVPRAFACCVVRVGVRASLQVALAVRVGGGTGELVGCTGRRVVGD